MKLVSVIVPNYRHAPYLKERLDSVLSQDYANVEVIVLDDCSPDDSMEILSAYEGQARVKAIIRNDKNSGNTFIQWRKGLEKATGEYVWIAESDDVAEPTLLSRLLEELEREDEDGQKPVAAFSASRWIDEQGREIKRRTTPLWRRSWRMNGREFVARYLLGYNYICNASAVVMRRDAALAVSERCQRYRASGDRQFWIEIAMQGSICYVAEPLNRFRQHDCKVSNAAERQGRNMMEDHAIYAEVKQSLSLSTWRKLMVCGYHQHAMCRAGLSADVADRVARVWGEEREWSCLSRVLYLSTRVLERLGCRC